MGLCDQARGTEEPSVLFSLVGVPHAIISGSAHVGALQD